MHVHVLVDIIKLYICRLLSFYYLVGQSYHNALVATEVVLPCNWEQAHNELIQLEGYEVQALVAKLCTIEHINYNHSHSVYSFDPQIDTLFSLYPVHVYYIHTHTHIHTYIHTYIHNNDQEYICIIVLII